jgi:hypothetical protein
MGFPRSVALCPQSRRRLPNELRLPVPVGILPTSLFELRRNRSPRSSDFLVSNDEPPIVTLSERVRRMSRRVPTRSAWPHSPQFRSVLRGILRLASLAQNDRFWGLLCHSSYCRPEAPLSAGVPPAPYTSRQAGSLPPQWRPTPCGGGRPACTKRRGRGDAGPMSNGNIRPGFRRALCFP